jgi:hypothetical protein
MADQNPTGDGAAVALTIPPDDLKFLRSTFAMVRDGLREELVRFPDKLLEPERLQREVATYGRLLDALDALSLSVIPDRKVCEVVAHVAQVIDQGNEYSRVVAEHAALHGLLDQLAGSPGGA